MKKYLSFLLIVVLSALFTFAFFFLMLESVRVADEFLLNIFPDRVKIQATTEFLRPIGYAAFGITVALILVGFAIRKGYLSTTGSAGLYLPVFGHFACTMFFLAGMGATRALWLPLMDCFPFLLSLGNIVVTPFLLLIFASLSSPSSLQLVVKAGETISYIIIGAGIFVFFLGALTWLYGKFKGREIVDFWIYKVSRHPQYLGFLLWSYGMLTLTIFLPQLGYFPSPSLLWLVSALTLIGTAIDEEMKMIAKYGEKYLKYHSSAPFMLPLPRQISDLILFPAKFVIKKEMPESRKELVYALTIYCITIILLSIPPRYINSIFTTIVSQFLGVIWYGLQVFFVGFTAMTVGVLRRFARSR